MGGAEMTTLIGVDNPEHWRERAEDIRRTTSSIHDPEVKARLLRIADGYEMLGRRTSRIIQRRCGPKAVPGLRTKTPRC
jgi:hypothetical protein